MIYRILEDKQQNLWCSSNKGIFRVNKNELDKVAGGAVFLRFSTARRMAR